MRCILLMYYYYAILYYINLLYAHIIKLLLLFNTLTRTKIVVIYNIIYKLYQFLKII